MSGTKLKVKGKRGTVFSLFGFVLLHFLWIGQWKRLNLFAQSRKGKKRGRKSGHNIDR